VINQKTALLCAALIVLMLAMAVGSIVTLEDRTAIAAQNGPPLPSQLFFLFPACSALFVGALYWTGLRVRADAARVEPWRKWGAFVSISYCGCLLLAQAVLIIGSLKLDLPVHFSPIGRTLAIMMAIMSLLAINQMPKLPYFERRLSPGGDLGPIYGPRYMRIQSRILVLFIIAVTAYSLAAAPSMVWRSTLFILLAAAFLMVWSVAWRIHLGRKWKLQQLAERGLEA
jgi:hypothetical protein